MGEESGYHPNRSLSSVPTLKSPKMLISPRRNVYVLFAKMDHPILFIIFSHFLHQYISFLYSTNQFALSFPPPPSPTPKVKLWILNCGMEQMLMSECRSLIWSSPFIVGHNAIFTILATVLRCRDAQSIVPNLA